VETKYLKFAVHYAGGPNTIIDPDYKVTMVGETIVPPISSVIEEKVALLSKVLETAHLVVIFIAQSYPSILHNPDNVIQRQSFFFLTQGFIKKELRRVEHMWNHTNMSRKNHNTYKPNSKSKILHKIAAWNGTTGSCQCSLTCQLAHLFYSHPQANVGHKLLMHSLFPKH
jgi:hypothetical protein